MYGAAAGWALIFLCLFLVVMIGCTIGGIVMFRRLQKQTASARGIRRSIVLLWTLFFPLAVAALLATGAAIYSMSLDSRNVDFGRVLVPEAEAYLRHDRFNGALEKTVYFESMPALGAPQHTLDLTKLSRSGAVLCGRFALTKSYFLWDTNAHTIENFGDRAALDRAASEHGIDRVALVPAVDVYQSLRKSWIDVVTIAAIGIVVALYTFAWWTQVGWLRRKAESENA